ncbi:MAG: PH domain-containing protein, partial [Blastocatellia bacterium]|nr:PH domain-containing protein [Blastocatellia bacterium]
TAFLGLLGLFLVFMGWSCSRINITANNQGIYYQGILRSDMIRWEDITDIRIVRSKTRLLTHLVYIVRSSNTEIVFAHEDYEDGLELANIIAKRSKM